MEIQKLKALLLLKDGTAVPGQGFGAKTGKTGELVFNTSTTGYQEALTDPSYRGQILLMTYPLIGNYGTCKSDSESGTVHPAGFVVRKSSADFFHRSQSIPLSDFLKDNDTPGISGIDTRFIVRKIRASGVMPAAISVSEKEPDIASMRKQLESFDYSAHDYVREASIEEPKVFGTGKRLVAMIDYGAKMNIIRELVSRDCRVHLFPCSVSAEEIRAIEPDGIMLSNGPGDPSVLTYAYKTLRELGGYRPMFAICLGHQLIAHAFGGSTFKLKFGHRGSNHAVIDEKTGKTSITTQNHGFAVDEIPEGFGTTHTNANDRTVEGMENPGKQIFSVQYHPEACPGPHDSGYLFEKFIRMIQ